MNHQLRDFFALPPHPKRSIHRTGTIDPVLLVRLRTANQSVTSPDVLHFIIPAGSRYNNSQSQITVIYYRTNKCMQRHNRKRTTNKVRYIVSLSVCRSFVSFSHHSRPSILWRLFVMRISVFSSVKLKSIIPSCANTREVVVLICVKCPGKIRHSGIAISHALCSAINVHGSSKGLNSAMIYDREVTKFRYFLSCHPKRTIQSHTIIQEEFSDEDKVSIRYSRPKSGWSLTMSNGQEQVPLWNYRFS